jgi:hypothetical protein
MDNVQRDDVIHALKYCYSFYRKPFLDVDKQVWGGMIRDHNYTSQQWQEEIRVYMARGTFCPKPKEILGQLAENHERKVHKRLSEPTVIEDTCPPEVSAAWRYWTPIFHGQELPFASNKLDADEEQAERWLLIVNREARRMKLPESVPEQYQLKEVWGG